MTTTTTETTSTETSTTEGETAGADGEAASADGEAAGAESSTMTTTMTETTTTTLDSNSVTVAMATELLQDAMSAQEIAQMAFDNAMKDLAAAESSGTTEEIEAATLVRDEAMMTLTSAMTFT